MRYLLLILVALQCSDVAFAFPELTKHGYPNCTACHVSPTGGGVLTEYGRALSKELLSTWGVEGEERAFWFLAPSETVAVGGDYRWLYLKDETPTTIRERGIPMQKDLEVALTYKRLTADMTFGFHDPDRKKEDKFISRRHYLLYQVSDELSVRGGRFFPAFGIYIADHYSVIRQGIGWDQGISNESYNIEGAWQTEQYNLFVTAVLGRPDDPSLKREKGGTISAAYNPTDKHKIGASYYYGETDEVTRHVAGPYAILGFSDKVFLLSQVNLVRTFDYNAPDAALGLVDYQRLDYEPFRGFHAFITQEFQQLDLKSNPTRRDIFGVGLQFFPRPHFEFQTVWQKIYSQGLSGTPTDRFMFLAHFYP